MQEIWIQSLGQEDPLEKRMATLSSILALENPMDREAWRGYSPWGHRELDSTEQLTLSLSGASSFLFLGLSFVLMKWWV